MQQREFALYKRRLLSLIPGKLQDIPNREVLFFYLFFQRPCDRIQRVEAC